MFFVWLCTCGIDEYVDWDQVFASFVLPLLDNKRMVFVSSLTRNGPHAWYPLILTEFQVIHSTIPVNLQPGEFKKNLLSCSQYDWYTLFIVDLYCLTSKNTFIFKQFKRYVYKPFMNNFSKSVSVHPRTNVFSGVDRWKVQHLFVRRRPGFFCQPVTRHPSCVSIKHSCLILSRSSTLNPPTVESMPEPSPPQILTNPQRVFPGIEVTLWCHWGAGLGLGGGLRCHKVWTRFCRGRLSMALDLTGRRWRGSPHPSA